MRRSTDHLLNTMPIKTPVFLLVNRITVSLDARITPSLVNHTIICINRNFLTNLKYVLKSMSDDGVATTILDLQLYVRVKRLNVTYFLYVTSETTARDIKRKMRQFTGRKCHDIHFLLPRYNYRKFQGRISFEQAILQNGEVLIMSLRKPGTDDYETLEEVTGDYNTTTAALYR